MIFIFVIIFIFINMLVLNCTFYATSKFLSDLTYQEFKPNVLVIFCTEVFITLVEFLICVGLVLV